MGAKFHFLEDFSASEAQWPHTRLPVYATRAHDGQYGIPSIATLPQYIFWLICSWPANKGHRQEFMVNPQMSTARGKSRCAGSGRAWRGIGSNVGVSARCSHSGLTGFAKSGPENLLRAAGRGPATDRCRGARDLDIPNRSILPITAFLVQPSWAAIRPQVIPSCAA